MAIFRVRDENGNIIDIPAIKGTDGADGADGARGADGKSAYEYAKDGGYTGSEEEFAEKLALETVNDDGKIPFARYAVYVTGKTVDLTSGAMYADLTVDEVSGEGSAVIIPVLHDTFGLLATVKYDLGKYHIHITRSAASPDGDYVGVEVDYWILSETAI